MPSVNEFAHTSDQREYVALKVLKVGVNDDGTPIYRDVGEPVPEAKDWPQSAIAALLHTNQIGQGPALDTHVEVQQLRKDVEKLRDRVEALATERDALREQLAAAQQPEQDDPEIRKSKTMKLPAPTPTQKTKE